MHPGPVGEELRAGFAAYGYDLLTEAPVQHGLIEVYPHPALIELTGAPRRLPYKEGKVRQYWPDQPMVERRQRLIEQWQLIVGWLDREIDGVGEALGSILSTAPRTFTQGL